VGVGKLPTACPGGALGLPNGTRKARFKCRKGPRQTAGQTATTEREDEDEVTLLKLKSTELQGGGGMAQLQPHLREG
jgi:hypothetical protein